MSYVTVASLLLTGNRNFHFTALFKVNTVCNAAVTSNMQENLIGSSVWCMALYPWNLLEESRISILTFSLRNKENCRLNAVVQWLRCCATNRKVAGSIPDGVGGFFIDIKSFRSHYDLGSTQPLTEMSTRSISWGQRQSVHKADNLPPSCAAVTKSESLNFLEPSGPVQACNGTVLLLPLPFKAAGMFQQ